MAIHEYACPKCGEEYEQREPMDSPRTQYCIKMCGGLAERVMSTPLIGRTNSRGNGHGNSSNQSTDPQYPIPEQVMKKAQEIKENTGANYVLAGPIIQSQLWAIAPIPDHVGEAMVRTEKMIKAAPNN